MDIEKRLRDRLAKVAKDRAEFVEEANRNIGLMNAIIAELKRLLEPEPENAEKT